MEEYLSTCLDKSITEHVLCAKRAADRRVVFYIYPMFGTGETLDFSVEGDTLTRLSEMPE